MKTKFKILIVLLILLGAMFVFSTSKVEASSNLVITGGTPTANSLDNIPNTINVNVKESEYEKVTNIIMNQIKTELESQGITLGDIGWNTGDTVVSVWFGDISSPIGHDIYTDIHKANIWLRTVDGADIVKKEVTINYSNTANYNNNDKNNVENLINSLGIKSSTITMYERPSENISRSDYAKQYLLDKINDKSITLVLDGRTAFDIDFLEVGFNVFKNDVLYNSIKIIVNVYEVTENVDIGENIVVSGLLEDVNITVTTTENNDMVTELKNKNYTHILGAYEFTLKGATELVNPIDITFNVGKEHNNKAIYILHQKKNGTFESFEKVVANGKVTITVSELSPFVLGLKEDTTNNNQTEDTTNNNQTTDTTNTNTNTDNEKDNTPKTGTTDVIFYITALTVIAGIGIIAFRKREIN